MRISRNQSLIRIPDYKAAVGFTGFRSPKGWLNRRQPSAWGGVGFDPDYKNTMGEYISIWAFSKTTDIMLFSGDQRKHQQPATQLLNEVVNNKLISVELIK